MLKMVTVNNALFIPGGWSKAGRHDFLCDEHGDVVRESCQIRGPSPQIPEEQNATNPDVTRIADAARSAPLLKGEYLFLGRVDIGHFGHAITGLAQFWAIELVDRGNLRIPVGTDPFGRTRIWQVLFDKDGSGYISTAIKSYELSKRNFLYAREPVRLAKIVVPEASAVLRQRFFPEHLETTGEYRSISC